MLSMRLRQLERAYQGARTAADTEREALERSWTELKAAVEKGEASFTEEDEDGQVLYDAGDRYADQAYDIDTTINLVREAFVISLSHLWERELNSRRRVQDYEEAKAFAYLRAQGETVPEDVLTDLRLTANVAKHSAGTSAEKLFERRPEFFDAPQMDALGAEPSYEFLLVTDQMVADFFPGFGPRFVSSGRHHK